MVDPLGPIVDHQGFLLLKETPGDPAGAMIGLRNPHPA